MIEDPPYAGDELRVIPPQPTVPTNLLMPGPSLAGNIEEYPRPSLPSYEEMMLDDMFNGPSSMETQPDLAPVKVLEVGSSSDPRWSTRGMVACGGTRANG